MHIIFKFVFVVLVLSIQISNAQNLPDFGNPADYIITKNQERDLGRSVIAQLRSANAIVEDPLISEYIQNLGDRLVGHVSDGTQEFNFYLIDDSSINAFALPGGFIGINSGLLMMTQSESELASVLAHEIAHVTQRHIARSIYNNQQNTIISSAAMIAAVLLGASSDISGNAMTGIVTAAQAANAQSQINFTRSNEHEADRIGIQTLSSAGFDPNAMSGFFEKMARRYGSSQSDIFSLLQTHPVTTERIAEARDRARHLPNKATNISPSYSLLKARLRVLQSTNIDSTHNFFVQRSNNFNPHSNDYGIALCLSLMGRDDEAVSIFRSLVENSKEVIAYRIGLGETLLQMGKIDDALKVYAESVNLFPRNVPLTISYSQLLILSDDASLAHKVLLDLLNNVTPTPEQIRLIARAANAEGDTANAHYYMGEYYITTGNLPLAINQINMALESPNVNQIDKSRFQARLNQISEY